MHIHITKMNKLFLLLLMAPFSSAAAQDATYHLPKTAIETTVFIEKSVYTPGDLALYSQRFLKKSAGQEKTEQYRILSIDMAPVPVPDTTKVFTAHIDQKHNIQRLALSDDNILLAVNAEPAQRTGTVPFAPAPRPRPIDPYKYLSQEILSVGSKMKMAELCAKEIYDIRESRNELTRGQADYMPKDGEQLRIMLQNLETQETAIRQMFEGVTVTDTLVATVRYIPEGDVKDEPLFRFSRHYGLLASDDLAGDPYLITVDDLHSMPERINEAGKKHKDETGIWVVLPGKVRVTLTDGKNSVLKSVEFSASQYGDVENLNEPLFSKKVMTRLNLNPYNGGIEKIESEPLK